MRSDFDFDYWANLSRVDPEAFDKQSKFVFKVHIKHVAKRDKVQKWRLEGLQVKVSKRLARFKNPVSRMTEIGNMMWDSFEELNRLLNRYK